MRIALLDPGLQTRTGHHFDLDRRLVNALSALGHSVCVHGSVEIDSALRDSASVAGMELQATFRVPTYAAPSRSEQAWAQYQRMETATTEDLRLLPPADLWFWPTLTPSQLAAGLAVPDAPPQLGGLWWTPRFPAEVGARSWARSLQAHPNAHDRFIVGAYDDEIVRSCRTYSPESRLVRLPCPHDGSRRVQPVGSLQRIGFFGHQRMERGADLLPGLVQSLVQRGYRVVVHDSAGIIEKKRADPRLEVLHFIDDFAAQLAQCDLVIWPSRPESYLQNCSGVVSECIASGVPVIVPSGCIPAAVVVRLGCANLFHEYTQGGILEAFDQVASEFDRVSARAWQAVDRWHADNGTAKLAEWIHQHFGGG